MPVSIACIIIINAGDGIKVYVNVRVQKTPKTRNKIMEYQSQFEAISVMTNMANICKENGFFFSPFNTFVPWGRSESEQVTMNYDKIEFFVEKAAIKYMIRTKIRSFLDNKNEQSNSFVYNTFAATPANILQLIEDCRAFVKSSPVTPK